MFIFFHAHFLYTLILITSFLTNACFSQVGFSKIYDYGNQSLSFESILRQGDSLIVYGTAKHPSTPGLFGLYCAILDFDGNILAQDTFFDPQNLLLAEAGNKITSSTTTGDMWMTGTNGTQLNNPILVCFDKFGQFKQRIYYQDANAISVRLQKTHIDDTGLLVMGYQNNLGNSAKSIIMKMSFSGEVLWKKYFSVSGRNVWIDSFVPMDNGHYLIALISSYMPTNLPQQAWNYQTIFLELDSTGQELMRWEKPISQTKTGAAYLQRTPDGHWMHLTAVVTPSPLSGLPQSKTLCIKRDSNFDIIEEKTISPFNTLNSSTCILIPTATAEAGWYGIGTVNPSYNQPFPPFDLSGWLYKIDGDFESIWSRTDTVFYNTAIQNEHSFRDGVLLPDGSLLACGKIDAYSNNPPATFAWLLKVDANGCLSETDCATVNTNHPSNENPPVDTIDVYPNPTADLIYILLPNQEEAEYALYTVYGVNVQKGDIQEGQINIEHQPPGAYLLLVHINNQWVSKVIVKTE